MIDRRRIQLVFVWLALLQSRGSTQDVVGESRSAAELVRVVSWNIRYGSAQDGLDRWSLRRERVLSTIRALDADVLGLQEVEAFQVAQILEALPRYTATGVHRDDGVRKGEACTILFDRAKFVLAEATTFWLSETPDVIASKSWDSSMTRICSTARLIDVRSGARFAVFNAHFDHRGQRAREASAELILARVRAAHRRLPDDRIVVLGDLNADEDNQAVRTLLGPTSAGETALLRDSFRVLHPEEPGGSFNGFDPASDGGTRKIDYVLVGPGLEVVAADILREKLDGRHPSDHFPVRADLRVD
jgi:endonuclease/exonuclease/phosphatase family metal-dependent hydrolase